MIRPWDIWYNFRRFKIINTQLDMKKLSAFLFLLLSVMTGWAQETFVSGGENRTMIVYAPANLGQNRPLLISLHGMNQDAAYQRNQANYEAVADTAKFVVVYPNGINKGWDISGMKDVNFILDIIEEMSNRYQIDKNRVYLSGFSMGGMMTYFAATKIADRIAAFAPVSGYLMGGPNTNSSRPVPIIHTHGTSDDVCTYPSVQSHLDAWVRRNGCNSTPVVEKPKSGPANTNAELIRYKNGLDGVEVAHLKLPGKGHWHSNDPVVAMTNVEIWNFVSRYSLTPGPTVVSVSPEDGCFDMSTSEDRTFVIECDKPVDCSKVKFSMSEGSSSISLALAETGFSQTLTFTIPTGKTPQEKEYRFQLRDIYGEDGSHNSTSQIYYYTYGVQEVGEEMHIDTLLTQDWASQQEAIGEGIPLGWHRVNSNSDGAKDERFSGDANTGGCRMKYFEKGGDFDAGFYFSSREYNQATFTYGEYAPKLSLSRGHYQLSFRSVYWNDGARNNHVNFGLSVINSSNGNAVYSSASLTPTGCMSENTGQTVKGSCLHDLVFEVLSTKDYLLQYNIAAGWDGIILGPPTLTRVPSQAELYKGEFLRTLHLAQQMQAQLQQMNCSGDALAQLGVLTETIANYENLFSIHPSVYTEARLALLEAMRPLEALSFSGVIEEAPAVGSFFDLQGREVKSLSAPGIYVTEGRKILVK